VAGEKKMNHNGRERAPMPDVAGSVSGLAHDVIELTELQLRLLQLDVNKSTQKLRVCLILAIVGICLLIASIPVALFALAEVFAEQLDWSRSAAFGASALIGVILSAIFAGAAYGVVRSGLFSLERSREELNNNVAWVKTSLRNRQQFHTMGRS
jgi:hypothetical protein